MPQLMLSAISGHLWDRALLQSGAHFQRLDHYFRAFLCKALLQGCAHYFRACSWLSSYLGLCLQYQSIFMTVLFFKAKLIFNVIPTILGRLHKGAQLIFDVVPTIPRLSPWATIFPTKCQRNKIKDIINNTKSKSPKLVGRLHFWPGYCH